MARVKTHKKMSVKKKSAAVAATILCASLLLGGAFAWTDFSQSFINRFRGGSTPDVLLHDDFEPGINKDVYVENTGEQPVFVRVKFNEFLQIGNHVLVGGTAEDKSTWETHLFSDTAILGKEETYGLFDGACTLEAHDYYAWLMSGRQKVYLPGTSEISNIEWVEGETGGNGNLTKKTMATNVPVTMQEYMDKRATYDAEEKGRWVLDADGWCYWSKLLPKETATNLLLDDVKLLENKPDDNYYYAIDVILQAANKTEVYKFGENGETMSPDAESLIGGNTAEAAKEVIINNGALNLDMDADPVIPQISLRPRSTTETVSDFEWTWESSDQEEAVIQVNPETGAVTVVAEGGPVTVTGTGTRKSDGTKITGSYTVTVENPIDRPFDLIIPEIPMDYKEGNGDNKDDPLSGYLHVQVWQEFGKEVEYDDYGMVGYVKYPLSNIISEIPTGASIEVNIVSAQLKGLEDYAFPNYTTNQIESNFVGSISVKDGNLIPTLIPRRATTLAYFTAHKQKFADAVRELTCEVVLTFKVNERTSKEFLLRLEYRGSSFAPFV